LFIQTTNSILHQSLVQ